MLSSAEHAITGLGGEKVELDGVWSMGREGIQNIGGSFHGETQHCIGSLSEKKYGIFWEFFPYGGGGFS